MKFFTAFTLLAVFALSFAPSTAIASADADTLSSPMDPPVFPGYVYIGIFWVDGIECHCYEEIDGDDTKEIPI